MQDPESLYRQAQERLTELHGEADRRRMSRRTALETNIALRRFTMKPDANDEVAWERLKDAQRETDNRRLVAERGLRLALRLIRLLGARLLGRRTSGAAARDTEARLDR
jgi:hypothetical protein